MGLYKYTSFENVKFLLDGTVRFTQPKAFNDPFELLPEIYLSDYLNGFTLDVMKPRREPLPGLISDETIIGNDLVARDIREAVNDLIGIYCLTRNPDSLLMWSHYADEYKGVVVEFNEEHEFFSGLFPVKYQESRPLIDFTSLYDEEEQIRLSELCYKPSEWEYENEYRVGRNLADCKTKGKRDGIPVYVMNIPIECVKGITLGERMPVENQKYIYNKIRNTNICLNLAAISNSGYGFRKETIKTNVPESEMNPWISPRTAHIFKDLNCTLGEIARFQINKNPMSEMANKKA